jgi:hypothetical protein
MFAVYLIAGVVVTVILVMTVLSHHRTFKMTSRTAGAVVAANEVERQHHDRKWVETELVCRYNAGGTEREVKRLLRGRQAKRFPEGKTVPVRYDPAEPHVAEVVVR